MNRSVEGVLVGEYSISKRNVRVASGVETDWQKPGYQSATEDNEIAPLHITTMFLSVKG